MDKLSELINHKFETIIIERPELVDVHKYDFFYKEFDDIIRDIHSKYEGDIYLNISSGTPAMKNALNILAELMDIKLYPVQVSTPEKAHNPHEENKEDYDVESYWELNLDNTDFCDRSELINNVNQTALMTANNIKKLIDAYDYRAAINLAESIRDFINPNLIDILKIADSRTSLDKKSFDRNGGNKYDLIPIRDSDKRDIVEYILTLQIKVIRGEYADFLRAITPVFYEICKYAVEKNCGINLKSVTYSTSRNGAPRWIAEMRKCNAYLYNLFVKNYDEFRGGYVSSDSLTMIIREIDSNMARREKFNKFRGIEESVRNIAAHNLVAITDDWIKANCKVDSNGIIKMLKELVAYSDIKVSNETWDSYKLMNEFIKEQVVLK